jgi:hypothetical protein
MKSEEMTEMENKISNHSKRERAKQFVREVLSSEFGQSVDEDTINTVADKVLRSLPTDKDGRKDNTKQSGGEPDTTGSRCRALDAGRAKPCADRPISR